MAVATSTNPAESSWCFRSVLIVDSINAAGKKMYGTNRIEAKTMPTDDKQSILATLDLHKDVKLAPRQSMRLLIGSQYSTSVSHLTTTEDPLPADAKLLAVMHGTVVHQQHPINKRVIVSCGGLFVQLTLPESSNSGSKDILHKHWRLFPSQVYVYVLSK